MKSILCKLGFHKSRNTDDRGPAGEWKCIRPECSKITSKAIVWPRPPRPFAEYLLQRVRETKKSINPEQPTKRPAGEAPPPPPVLRPIKTINCPKCNRECHKYLLEASPTYQKTGFYTCACGYGWSKSNEIINQITEIRAKNNKYWMALLTLAFAHVPEEAKAIMKNIGECDKEINELTKQLAEG